MNDPLFFKRLLDTLLLPPGGPLLLIALGLVLWWRRAPRWAAALIGAGFVASYLFSTGAVSSWLIAPLERQYPPMPAQALRELMAADPVGRPQAVVVLGGGARRGALDSPDGETVHPRTLERLAAGVRVQRATGLPLLVSGGTAAPDRSSEAELMARALADLGVRARWVESGSLDTADNASRTHDLLAAAGIGRILLVTHAYHLPRAVPTFERTGLDVVAVPAAWLAQPVDSWRAFTPGGGLEASWIALHERAGRAWYRLRGLAGPSGATAEPDASSGAAAGLVAPSGAQAGPAARRR